MKPSNEITYKYVIGFLLILFGIVPFEIQADEKQTPEIIIKQLQEDETELRQLEQEIIQARRDMDSYLEYIERLDREEWERFYAKQDIVKDYHRESFEAMADGEVEKEVQANIVRINKKIELYEQDLEKYEQRLNELKNKPEIFQNTHEQYLSKLAREIGRAKNKLEVLEKGLKTGAERHTSGLSAAEEAEQVKRELKQLSELLTKEKKRDITTAIMDAEADVLKTNARISYLQKLLDDMKSWHSSRRPTFEEFFSLKYSSWPFENKPEDSDDYLLQRGLAQDSVVFNRDLIVRDIAKIQTLRWEMISLSNMWGQPEEGRIISEILSPPYLKRVFIMPATDPDDIDNSYRANWTHQGLTPEWELGLKIVVMQSLKRAVFDDIKEAEVALLAANQRYGRAMKSFGDETTYKNAIKDFIKILDVTKDMAGYFAQANVVGAFAKTAVVLYEEYDEGIKTLNLPKLSEELMDAIEANKANPVLLAKKQLDSKPPKGTIKTPMPKFTLTTEEKKFTDEWWDQIKVGGQSIVREEYSSFVSKQLKKMDGFEAYFVQFGLKYNMEIDELKKLDKMILANDRENIFFTPQKIKNIERVSRSADKLWHHFKSIGKAELDDALTELGKQAAAKVIEWAADIDPEAEFIKAGWISVDWLVARNQYHLSWEKYRRIEEEINSLMAEYIDIASRQHKPGGPTRSLQVDQPVPLKAEKYSMYLLFSRDVDLKTIKLSGRKLNPTLPPDDEFRFDFEIISKDLMAAKDGKVSLEFEAYGPGEKSRQLDAEPTSIPYLPVFAGYLNALDMNTLSQSSIQNKSSLEWKNYQPGSDRRNHQVLVERLPSVTIRAKLKDKDKKASAELIIKHDKH